MKPYYHTTLFRNLPSIADEGLRPRAGGGLFQHGGYAEHSQGRVFACEAGAALEWYGKVEDMAEYHYGDDGDPELLVPVMLRLNLEGFKVHRDEVGSGDAWGESVYVTETVPPERIEFWDPGAEGWLPIEDYDRADVQAGVKRAEHYDADGDLVDPSEWDESEGTVAFTVYGPYDRGGFKPSKVSGGW